ncbi:hypothetical protein POKO110462_22215 [Pontibacter korlensis]|uniref:TIGR02588 family protein n=1 Tax=Pontibacter korlensis TaxID=400092 RepID=A0A0E3ZIP3_9BACT|nr:hypothetical protein [Pontibacter korlensis]AKD05178.1 hypothetical protein PKOR_21540 [Pontibacter korlensis]
MEKDKNQRNGRNEDVKNWLEWTVFCVSLLLLLAIVGYLSYQVYTHKESPPDIYVEAWPSPSPNSPHRYHVLVQNKGGTTAEEVKVEVILRRDNQSVEASELQITFSPTLSKREGWVTFVNDPAKADTVVTRVVSYKKP